MPTSCTARNLEISSVEIACRLARKRHRVGRDRRDRGRVLHPSRPNRGVTALVAGRTPEVGHIRRVEVGEPHSLCRLLDQMPCCRRSTLHVGRPRRRKVQTIVASPTAEAILTRQRLTRPNSRNPVSSSSCSGQAQTRHQRSPWGREPPTRPWSDRWRLGPKARSGGDKDHRSSLSLVKQVRCEFVSFTPA